jgi:hypothetical protein
MIGYLIAWVMYLGTAWLLMNICRRHYIPRLPEHWQPVARGLIPVLLLTPWPIDGDTWALAPALIAVIFNLMEADRVGLLKSLFPLLLLSTLVCSVAWWKSRKAES